jgi:diguanylate cyclase (GGDEF)-like protein
MNRKLKILILAKEKTCPPEFRKYFKNTKIISEYNSSFTKALLYLKRNTPSVIILDLDSLYISPRKIAAFINKAGHQSRESLILLATSGSFLNLAIAICRKTGASYMKKPMEEREIRIAVDEFDKRKTILEKNKELKEQIERLIHRLGSITLVDPLTNCYNYRYLARRLGEELRRTQRYLRSLTLVLIDIESLHEINETYGDDFGDTIILQVANILKRNIRENDVLCRIGGGQFYVIMPETSKMGAARFCQRVCDDFSGQNFGTRARRITIKVRMGVGVYPSEGIDSVATFMKACRKALKISKSKGVEAFTFYSKSVVLKEKKEDAKTLKKKLDMLNQTVSQSLIDMIYGFAKTIEAKDHYTGKHVEDTSTIAEEIAKQFKLSFKEIEDIKHAAILHDLGKIGVEEKILRKKGKLTKKEMEKIKKHPLIASEILKSIQALSGAVPAILHHHESYDGQGYPYGLKADEIPLAARIIAVADAYQALTSDRPYRKAFSVEEAVKIIQQESGTHFDPKVVQAFLKIVK